MANMEFLNRNLADTTTLFKVDSSTNAVKLLFDNNLAKRYLTDGYTTNTSTIISVEFGSSTVIDHIFLLNHNLKTYQIYYNSNAANSLYTATSNSVSSQYIQFATTAVSSVQLKIDAAMTADSERYIGEYWVSRELLSFERNPSIQNFNQRLDRKQVRHEMPDGGVILNNVKDKYKATVKLGYISKTFKDNLYTVFNMAAPMIFVAEPTTTSWNGEAYAVVWSGDFDFIYEENSKTQGYGGKIVLEETPGG